MICPRCGKPKPQQFRVNTARLNTNPNPDGGSKMTNEKTEKMADALARHQRKIDQLTAENTRLRVQLRANSQRQEQELSFLPAPGDRHYHGGHYTPSDLAEETARRRREQAEIERHQTFTANLKEETELVFEPAVGDRDFKYNREAA